MCSTRCCLSGWLGFCAVEQQNQLDMAENTGDTQGETGDRKAVGKKEGSGEYPEEKPNTNKL